MYHRLGSTFTSKFDLADAYMCIWFQLNDIPSVAYLVPKDTDSETQLVGFHLSIPMGCVESTSFFCATTETIKDMANNTMHRLWKTPVHML